MDGDQEEEKGEGSMTPMIELALTRSEKELHLTLTDGPSRMETTLCGEATWTAPLIQAFATRHSLCLDCLKSLEEKSGLLHNQQWYEGRLARDARRTN